MNPSPSLSNTWNASHRYSSSLAAGPCLACRATSWTNSSNWMLPVPGVKKKMNITFRLEWNVCLFDAVNKSVTDLTLHSFFLYHTWLAHHNVQWYSLFISNFIKIDRYISTNLSPQSSTISWHIFVLQEKAAVSSTNYKGLVYLSKRPKTSTIS